MIQAATIQEHTVWGLTPADVHARYWASRGVQVVVPGRASEVVPHAELYLLTDPRTLCIFRVASILDTIAWLSPTVYDVRLLDPRQSGYREEVLANPDGRFVKFRRVYRGADHRVARVTLTTDPEVARLWQNAPTTKVARAAIANVVPRTARFTGRARGRVYNGSDPEECGAFLRDLVREWPRPDATIDRVRRVRDGVWADSTARVDSSASFVGPVWIGAGRELPGGASAVGPDIMWDRPDARPDRGEVRWMDLEVLSRPAMVRPPALPPLYTMAKRAFDVIFSLAVLLGTLPLYPVIMLAILNEDGRPFFFGHRRQTLGGREFTCWKFRSMRKDAERFKAQLTAENMADGPQFFIENDPRHTKVGRFLRKYQLDELPQFWNALVGDMSIVGPRPSPDKENQYCPGWREARLSVRPGITGLWQVRRTRAAGTDFQEWIRYDIEYVEKQGFWFDLWVIWKTLAMVVKGLIDR